LKRGGFTLLSFVKDSAMNDFCCSFAIFSYNIRMQQRDILIRKVQSATAYLETAQEMYQDKEAPLELVQLLEAVIGVLQEIRRDVITQELTSVLENEALPAATRKAGEAKQLTLITFVSHAQRG
jgi:DNA-binding FrmR family transcriptional regulator